VVFLLGGTRHGGRKGQDMVMWPGQAERAWVGPAARSAVSLSGRTRPFIGFLARPLSPSARTAGLWPCLTQARLGKNMWLFGGGYQEISGSQH
jgi:hypothetical protein